MKTNFLRRLFLGALVVVQGHCAFAQKNYSIFYLCIGSEHYEQNTARYEEGFLGLNDLEAAGSSATKMAELFKRMGAVSGKLLLSESPSTISKKSVTDQLKQLIKEIKTSKAKRPILMIYYAGHGFSSGDYKTHFIPPGNFVKSPKALTWESWYEHTIAPLDLRELIDENKISYMMFLDCCYEGELKQQVIPPKELQQSTGTEVAFNLFKDLGNIFDHMNTMTGPDPVIFSCPPGKTVTTDLYDFGDGKIEVAPLCRRIHLVLDQKLKGTDVSVSDLVVMLKSPDLDSRTNAAFTTWVFDAKNLNYIWKK